MPSRRPHILLLEDSEAEALRLLDWLADGFEVTHVTSVAAASGALRAGGFDAALVDLCVDDSRGLPTFLAVRAAAPTLPFVVQSGMEEQAIALEAVARGAQDYLIKRECTAEIVRRSLTYALERARVERELRESRERYQLALAGSNDGIWDWDLEGGRFHVSDRWAAMLGYALAEVGDTVEDWLVLVHEDDRDRLVAELEAHLNGENPTFDTEARLAHRDGTWRWMRTRGLAVRDAAGRATRIAGSQSDVTERHEIERRLVHQATTDALTGLANRAAFAQALEEAVARPRPAGRGLSVIYLDLDRFKVINDGLGHHVGDRLLIAFAHRLRTTVRPGDLLARLGGDEFALLVEGTDDPKRVEEVAARIHRSLGAPFTLGESRIFASVSVGIAHWTSAEDTAESLLRNADIAMYRSKRAGRSGTEVFAAAHHTAAAGQFDVETGLRRALENDELRIHYQPIVRIQDARLVGFEALVRWQAPDGRLMQPADFVPVAEETGLIDLLGGWVLRTACARMAALTAEYPGAGPLTMSVNVSSRQFAQVDFYDQVVAALADAGLPGSRLVLELTETTLMENPKVTAEVLQRLRDLGVHIHLDDFGVGYSSLSYLRRFPIDSLKIDRSFTAAVPGGKQDEAILRAIVSLAAALGLEVVAEGVENQAQWDHLHGLDCTYGQGFYFSKPLDGLAVDLVTRDASVARPVRRGSSRAAQVLLHRRAADVDRIAR